VLWLGAAAMLSTGCASYNWWIDYAAAEQEARESNKYLFIFYKWYLDNASSRMLGDEVLSSPEVMKHFQDTVNLLIDKEHGPAYVEYLRKYDVTEFPAAIIVAPDGTFQVRRGFVPKDRFIEFVEKAKQPVPERPRPPQPQPTGQAPPSSRAPTEPRK
jgi:thiol:disulfide interchange protein